MEDFVISGVTLNKNEAKLRPPDFIISSNIRLKGDYDNDKQADCFIWVTEDEAKNCGGKPQNNFVIKLQVEKLNYDLRCCGP